ncbi:MAG: GNAT family N-acetyltransferase [Candidatus Eisenbacteria bacterium]|uniref:GNAT family N-acetyltransferase n=1 Tax=Eiseniibacteriota bacterium TaxID=2212470 RepID=A0A956NCY8_UNCEI|nr:GNAT family N-acetyltransferase [Candidatus Eisenbacteria bacterium]MCB9465104.1 GNAT family N-acetyltransferase [Candidatus Eisenbacteria bacterium]
MEVKCFDCGESMTASDTDAVIEVFVAHGKANHDWSYPEEAVRNYARNYAEATERLSAEIDRRPEIGEVTIHPMTADRVEDWLRFFDHDGLAGNPDWASCYCLDPHESAPPEMPELPWRTTRGKMVCRFREGSTFGYLAYVEDRPVGWVNASLRSEYAKYQGVDPDGPEPKSVIGVSCYVIAPPFRGHGVASALLDRVIEDAASRGATWIEAYPHTKPEEGDAGHFRGPRSMYEARGFEPVEEQERFTVMRRRV